MVFDALLSLLCICISDDLLIHNDFVDLEWYMVSNKIITDSELDEDPRTVSKKEVSRHKGFSGHSLDDSDDDYDT